MTNRGRAIDDNVYDLNAILHPGSVYDHPRDVLADDALTLVEKRSILASWASDAAAYVVPIAEGRFRGSVNQCHSTTFLKLCPNSTMVQDHPAESRLGANRPRESQKRHEGGRHGWESTKGLRTSRAAPVKEALIVSGARRGKPGMIPAEDWLADLDAKIACLERGLGLESRPGD